MGLSENTLRQSAVIAVHSRRVCLIRSSSGKRWVVPKGRIERGHSASETALREAWEEAGLVGTLRRAPIGRYIYEKAGATCHVTLYYMRVTKVANSWPEQSRRRRRWVHGSTAADRITNPKLRKLLRRALAA